MKQRKRLTLQQKKCFVEKFKQEQLVCFNKSKESGVVVYEISSKQFCNANKIKNVGMLCKWLQMDRLGFLEEWSGRNDLNQFNVRKDIPILSFINECKHKIFVLIFLK